MFWIKQFCLFLADLLLISEFWMLVSPVVSVNSGKNQDYWIVSLHFLFRHLPVIRKCWHCTVHHVVKGWPVTEAFHLIWRKIVNTNMGIINFFTSWPGVSFLRRACLVELIRWMDRQTDRWSYGHTDVQYTHVARPYTVHNRTGK
jgi:hypothetical protein